TIGHSSSSYAFRQAHAPPHISATAAARSRICPCVDDATASRFLSTTSWLTCLAPGTPPLPLSLHPPAVNTASTTIHALRPIARGYPISVHDRDPAALDDPVGRVVGERDDLLERL